MKRKVFAISLVLALLISMFGVNALFVSAETADPTLKIEGQNLCFEDSVYLEYAVSSATEADVSLLIWLDAQEAYTIGTQDYKLSPYKQDTVAGKTCDIFVFTELAAKQMTDDVFAVAYTKTGDQDYYSPVKKYSILQYAYNKLNDDDASAELKTLLSGMLQYGAAAQTYFNYKTDRLATATYYKVKTEGGTFADGSTTGLFQENEVTTLKAAATNEAGAAFHHWQKADGTHVEFAADATATISDNQTLVAVYDDNGYTVKATVGTWDAPQMAIPTTFAPGTQVLVSAKMASFNCWDGSHPIFYPLKQDLSNVEVPAVADNAKLMQHNDKWDDIAFLATVANDGAVHIGLYPVDAEYGQVAQVSLHDVSITLAANKVQLNTAYNLNEGWGAFAYLPSDLAVGTPVTVKAMVKATFGGAAENTKSPTLFYDSVGSGNGWTVLADYNTLSTYTGYTAVTFDAVVGANGVALLLNPVDQITSQWGPSTVDVLPISITAK